MKKIQYAFLTLFLVFQFVGNAQVDFFNNTYVLLTQEQRFDSLLMLHKKLNAMDNTIPGYRIQIYFESGNYSKSKALEVKDEFELLYPGYSAYISFSEPYYRVKVGDFRTKIEAIGFLKKIIRKYPNAFEKKERIYINAWKE
ncbi:MAG: SPOR domain-containing protein [Bacteroidales bacterium]|nr:SPOR domain-containing protein [Bacteroidales bacterium]